MPTCVAMTVETTAPSRLPRPIDASLSPAADAGSWRGTLAKMMRRADARGDDESGADEDQRHDEDEVAGGRHERERQDDVGDADGDDPAGDQHPRTDAHQQPTRDGSGRQQRHHERRDGEGRDEGRQAQDEREELRQLQQRDGLREADHDTDAQHHRDRPQVDGDAVRRRTGAGG